jgi:hypothetical protein
MTLKDKIIKYYRTATTDSYAQLGVISVYSIAKTPEEREEIKKLVKVSVYGGRFGTYEAFNSFGGFLDKELEERCRVAFYLNENRIKNNNSL